MTTTDTCPFCAEAVGKYDQACKSCGKPLGGAAMLATNRPNTEGQIPPPPNNGEAILLGIVALAAGALGSLLLTQATAGVGLICGGCVFAVFARIAQAKTQHKQVLHAIRESKRIASI